MSAVLERPWDSATAPVIVDGPSQSEDEQAWREVRRGGIGGSDVSAILGMSQYRDAFAVYLDKTGQLGDQADNTQMAWGRRLEALVAEVWEDEYGKPEGLQAKPFTHTLAHPDRLWQRANLDRLLVDDVQPGSAHVAGCLEIKTASSYALSAWKDGVPDHAALQAYHYLDVTGLPFAWVTALVGGQHLFAHRLDRDEDFLAHLRGIEADFWHRVIEREPPAPTGLAATADLLAHLYDVTPDKIVDLDDDATEVIALLESIEHAKADAKTAETRKREAENRIKQLLGDAEVGRIAGQKAVSWKWQPETAVPATTRKAHRRFLPHKIEGLTA